jgi:alpha-tubulin suppressor-like RCC1 family protein
MIAPYPARICWTGSSYCCRLGHSLTVCADSGMNSFGRDAAVELGDSNANTNRNTTATQTLVGANAAGRDSCTKRLRDLHLARW